MEFCLCWRSSEVERLPCKQRVGGSNPLASSSRFGRLGSIRLGSGRYPSGQRGQTVNLLAHAFGGSNPPLPTISTAVVSGVERFAGLGPRSAQVTRRNNCGNSSAVERQPSKLGVAGSNPVSRSRNAADAHVAQSAERVLGKDEVSGSIPDMGSISNSGIVIADGRT